LTLLEGNKSYSNKSKDSLGKEDIEFLDHIVSKKGVKVDPKKIVSTTNWPSPKIIMLLCGFLGLTWYYRRFLKNYAKIATPLITLLKKHALKWDDAT